MKTTVNTINAINPIALPGVPFNNLKTDSRYNIYYRRTTREQLTALKGAIREISFTLQEGMAYCKVVFGWGDKEAYTLNVKRVDIEDNYVVARYRLH